jgi:hypothetical protein
MAGCSRWPRGRCFWFCWSWGWLAGRGLRIEDRFFAHCQGGRVVSTMGTHYGGRDF